MEASILIVEDERIVAKDLQHSLTRLGYTVTAVAASGEEAIRQAETNPPDLVLMDIRLAGTMDGVQAAEEVRARLHLPVVYLTAYADAETVQRAKITEPFGYLLKPFEERELQTVIEMALYKHSVERRLQESRQWLLTTLCSIGDGVIATDDAGLVKFMNPVAETLTGWRQEEATGLVLSDVLKLVDETTRQPKESPVGTVLAEGRSMTLSSNTLLVGRDQREILIGDGAAPIRDEKGRILGAVLVFQDNTERRRLEEQLIHAQKMESIGRLAGGIAHDFNNLLTAILGYTELAQDEITSESLLYSYLETVRLTTLRATALTGQLLAFARRQITEPKIINLSDLILDLDKMLRRLISENIELVILPAPDLWPVRVDPGQMEQIILNLAVNARDAILDNGKLTIETANVTLNEEDAKLYNGASPGDYVMLVVSDTGVGIEEAILHQIFEPFFTTKEVGKGTGLGLAICYGVVKQNQGHIQVHSTPGQGTTFKIYLPRERNAAVSYSTSRELQAPRGTETILLVEDETVVRMMAGAILRAQGYTILEAAGGSEALMFAVQHSGPIHLLVTDVVMPQMGGRQLAEQFRGARPGAKVLYTSGYMDDAGTHQGVFEKAAFLQKPYTPGRLAHKVREVLDVPAE